MMMNLNKRCPWCGNVLKEKRRFFAGATMAVQCKKCSKYSAPYERVTLFILSIAMFVSIFNYLYFSILFFFMYDIFYTNFVPRTRIDFESKLPYDSLKEKLMFYANIDWNQSRIRNFKIWNNKLFIITFLENDIPVSQAICVRITLSKNHCMVHQIDDSQEFRYKQGMEFAIFDGTKRVGTGVAEYTSSV